MKLPLRRADHLLLLIMAVFAALVGAVGWGYYRRQEATLLRSTEEKLGAIANLGVSLLTRWRQTRPDDANLELDGDEILFPYLQAWPKSSRTAETLLVRPGGGEAVVLSQPRHRTNAVLKLRSPLAGFTNLLAVVVLGRDCVFHDLDYRGEAVLAVARRVPDSPWVVVAKQDLAEICAPLRAQAWSFAALSAALMLSAALGLKLVWRNREYEFSLQELEERRRAEQTLRETRDQLLQASRLAGMAEVATSVLHNVGNILNSVNVSASLLADQVKRSRAGRLRQVAALMREHAADLGEFITRHPRGRHLPAFLTQLADCLAAEQNASLTELNSLKTSIEHMRDVITAQQSCARIGASPEKIRATDLIEDALRINASSLTRRHIQLTREYDPHLPEMTIDRHKVLQILVNLLRNALYACDDSGRPDKRITLSAANSNGTVKLSVVDNGVGIPAENLNRIFDHGFTTRKNGHGFGLHSGALLAREMGGSLRAHSDGVGRGAVFTLELPLRSGDCGLKNA